MSDQLDCFDYQPTYTNSSQSKHVADRLPNNVLEGKNVSREIKEKSNKRGDGQQKTKGRPRKDGTRKSRKLDVKMTKRKLEGGDAQALDSLKHSVVKCRISDQSSLAKDGVFTPKSYKGNGSQITFKSRSKDQVASTSEMNRPIKTIRQKGYYKSSNASEVKKSKPSRARSLSTESGNIPSNISFIGKKKPVSQSKFSKNSKTSENTVLENCFCKCPEPLVFEDNLNSSKSDENRNSQTRCCKRCGHTVPKTSKSRSSLTPIESYYRSKTRSHSYSLDKLSPSQSTSKFDSFSRYDSTDDTIYRNSLKMEETHWGLTLPKVNLKNIKLEKTDPSKKPAYRRQRQIYVHRNPFINFLRNYKKNHLEWHSCKVAIEGARKWCTMNIKERTKFSYENQHKRSGQMIEKRTCRKVPKTRIYFKGRKKTTKSMSKFNVGNRITSSVSTKRKLGKFKKTK